MNITSKAASRGQSAFLKAAKFVVPGGGVLTLAAMAQAQPDYPGCVWRPPNCVKYYTSGNGHHFCVIHDMEGYYYTAISYMDRCDTSAGGGYNVDTSVYYAVNGLTDSSDNGAPPGQITQMVRESYYAWHAVCWNTWMFGTEHEGFASNPAWFTEAMYQASSGLQRHLCDTYGIPKDRNHIIAHGQKLVAGWCTWLAANYPSINCTCNSHTDPGPYWDWTHFMNLIIGQYNGASVAGSSIPSVVYPGRAFTATITMNNNGTTSWTSGGANAYRLGSQSPQDNSTWGFGRVELPSSPVNAGQNATFTINATAPSTPGVYTFAWRMVQEGVEWFGDTCSATISVVGSTQGGGIPISSYTVEWQGNPTSLAGGWGQSTCSGGATEWRTWGVNVSGQSCTVYDRNCYWNSAQSWSGRGHFNTDVQITCSGTAQAKYVLLDGGNGDTGTQPTLNQCPLNGWYGILNSDWTDLNINGWRTNPNIADGGSGCNTTCGYPILAAAGLHLYGARWQYINDWTCLGGYGSGSVSDTANRSFAWGESGLYLYPAMDTTHGNHLAAGMGLSGKTPGRVTTGDCNNANILDFKGNANAYGGGDNMDAYAFAWVYAPAGAGPKFLIGSDDGNRVWVNGNLINDNNASRGLTRDEDETGGIGLGTGWNRVIFKVHNGGGGFAGTVSLRNGGDRRWNEPSVNVFDFGGFYSYGIAYEQDEWYPRIQVAGFYGATNSQPNDNLYGNNTTVTASGTASVTGPVPFWKVMHYEWGYGLSGESDYTDVTSSGATWSHTQTGVTGHRRFHFFSVSQSGRTSFQNSGATGGSNWADNGPGNYLDVYIDNVAPQNPSFSSATSAGPGEVDLAWALPPDQGVGIEPGVTEAADETSSSSGNYYRVGDVGVQVYRNGSPVYAWGAASSFNDTGLAANTQYTYTIEARDNATETRGAWHNSTGPQGSIAVWTLSVPPGAGSVSADQASPRMGSNVTWTASGFGPGQVQYYRYAWDTSPTHTWTDMEAQWAGGALTTVPASQGAWYLHVKGYNGADVGNGTFDYSVTSLGTCSQTNAIVGIADNLDGTFTLMFMGTPQAQYYVVATPDSTAPIIWATLPGSTNTVTNVSGLWSYTVTNTATQQFYRSAAVVPCP